jgi:all-trans-retinol 13,14-reductase
MKRRYPQDAAGIDRVLAAVAACVGENPWLGLGCEAVDWDAYQKSMEVSARDVLEAHLASPELREVFASFAFNTALPADRCPFGLFAFTFHVLTTSCSRVRGGGAALIGALVRRLRALGGTLLLGRSAERLAVDGASARALELSDGTVLDLDLLVSTCHPLETVRFCGRDRFRSSFLEQVETQEQTPGSFKVYLETAGPVESLGRPGLYVASPSAMDPGGGRHVAEILFWQDFREVEAWKDSAPGRRPRGYAEFQERQADAAVERAEREFPGIRGAVRHRYTATPLTNLRYTRSARGAAMGASQDVAHQGRLHLRPRNRLRNVYLAGQSLATPGIIGCVIYSGILCDSILPELGLLRRLKDVTF